MARVVTFDCAQTLIKVDWQPAVLAVKSAKRAGLEFESSVAAEIYDRKLRSRWPEFRELNKSRDPEVLAAFWDALTHDWMIEAGLDASYKEAILAEAERLLFGEESRVFKIYDDVVPCLQALKEAGVRLGVISNWDHSLHRTLAMFGIGDYFEVVLASLEEGVEKPDPGLFHIALERLGVGPEDVLHVGDNAVDDWQGARAVGMRAVLIDRDVDEPSPTVITHLEQLHGILEE